MILPYLNSTYHIFTHFNTSSPFHSYQQQDIKTDQHGLETKQRELNRTRRLVLIVSIEPVRCRYKVIQFITIGRTSSRLGKAL